MITMNSNLHNLLNVIAEDESYLDIDVIVENAPLKTSKLPVILFSHGLGG